MGGFSAVVRAGLRGGIAHGLAFAWGMLGWSVGWAAIDEEVRDRAVPAASVPASMAPAEARIRKDVEFLADDAREGRSPGSEGIEQAARYIAETFESLGLKPPPGGEGYFQKFNVSGRPKLGEPLELRVETASGEVFEGVPKTQFSPLAVGSGGVFEELPVVFAGYGITARDEARKLDYDDYAGIDVRGKAVLIIRREPQQDRDDSPFDGKKTTSYATFQHKATNAFQQGAAAVLLVNDLAGLGTEPDNLLSLLAAGPEMLSKIPFVMVAREFADRLLAAAGAPSLADLERSIDEDLRPRSRELAGLRLSGSIPLERPSLETRNVVAVLEGAGPLAEETVVVGAHYDHLGRGGLMSGSLAFLSNDIHNGADDNASGTALMLELARRLAARPDPLPRRVVFIAFSAEERGLIGSQYYVEHPFFPLESTVMMLNFDMVGRLNGKNELTMIGTGTSPGIEAIVEALGRSAGLEIKKVPGLTDGFGGSDHQSFYAKNIPVLFAFTGIHSDYHRPSDDSDRINFAGLVRLADYLELILLDIVRRPERPPFARLAAPQRGGPQASSPSMRSGVSLGVMPDYADESSSGMKITGVREGGPAAKAGLMGGDSIIRVGGKAISTIYDYMESLSRYQPGETVDVVVRRDGKEVTIPVKLEAPSSAVPHN